MFRASRTRLCGKVDILKFLNLITEAHVIVSLCIPWSEDATTHVSGNLTNRPDNRDRRGEGWERESERMTLRLPPRDPDHCHPDTTNPIIFPPSHWWHRRHPPDQAPQRTSPPDWHFPHLYMYDDPHVPHVPVGITTYWSVTGGCSLRHGVRYGCTPPLSTEHVPHSQHPTP